MILHLHPEAEQDAQDAYDYYFKREPDVAQDFADKLEATILAVGERPARFSAYRYGTRHALLKPFPHHVIFHYSEESKVVKVLAVAHTTRREAYWRDRL